MSLFGTLFSLFVGPTVPIPAPPFLLEGLERLEVQHSDNQRSGFQMIFKLGRDRTDILDYKELIGPLLRPFSRVIMTVTFNAIPQVLFDGVVINQQLTPSEEPGGTRLTVTGEDLSAVMDLEEKSAEHPAQPEALIAAKLIGVYAPFGIYPVVIPPPFIDPPLPFGRVPKQAGTDWQYLNEMAARFAYTVYVEAGPVPHASKAYWGPPVRAGIPQRALSSGMGSDSNLIDISFDYDGRRPMSVEGWVQDSKTDVQAPVVSTVSTRPSLASQPAWLTQPHIRKKAYRESGPDIAKAFARVQAEMEKSQDSAVRGTGELDALRYEAILKPRGVVGVRGVGFSYDGLYYVQQVSHTLERGSYRQKFTLEREGLGAISPVVVP